MVDGIPLKITIVVFSLFSLAASVAIIYMSVVQMNNSEFAEDFDFPGGGCVANQVFDSHRPIKFQVANVTETFQCGWNKKNSALRFAVYGLAAIVVSMLLIFSLLRPSPWGTRITLMIALVMLGGVALSVFFDVTQILSTQKWCEENLADSGIPDTAVITCNNFVFISLSLAQAASGLVWIVLFFVSCSHMKNVKKAAKRRREEEERFAGNDEESRSSLMELTSMDSHH